MKIMIRLFPMVVILWMIGLSSCSKKESSTEQSAAPVQDTIKGSPAASAEGAIGACTVSIAYHSPAVRGRVVWGGLVPFDQVWVTGAHMATSVEFSGDVEIGEKTVKAGKYALFTIPGKEDWVVILNSNWQQHLADDYDEKLDVVRVTVEPETEDTHQERLKYEIEQEGEGEGEIVIYWEKVEVSLPVRCAQQ